MSKKPEAASSGRSGGTDRRATRWDAHKAQRRQHILDAAIATIEELGGDVSVHQIAERAQVTRAVVYRFFDDRGDLDRQIRQHVADRLLADLTPTLTLDGTAHALIERCVHTYLTWTTEHPQLHQYVGSRSTHPGGGRSVATGAKTALALQISALFRSVLEALDRETAAADSLAFGVIGMVDWTVNRWLVKPALDRQQLEAMLCRWIWQLVDTSLTSQYGVRLDPDVALSELLAPSGTARR